jgi:hypothetical protein
MYLKYLCASNGVMDTKAFSVGLSEDPIFILCRKLTDTILLKDFPEYHIQTRFDSIRKKKPKGGKLKNLSSGREFQANLRKLTPFSKYLPSQEMDSIWEYPTRSDTG